MRIVEIERNGEMQKIVTYLEVNEVEQLQGIPPQAVVGILTGDNAMQVNALFREFLHETIAFAAPLDPDLQSAARTHGDGRLVYIDSRVPETTHPVPGEDIIGWFLVRAGQIVEGSYMPNPGHTISGVHGLTAAIGGMRQPMVNALIKRESP
jgi:hypothetical protein